MNQIAYCRRYETIIDSEIQNQCDEYNDSLSCNLCDDLDFVVVKT